MVHNPFNMTIKFRQYNHKDDCYRPAWDLRQQVLRSPLGLSLTEEDRENDYHCWHFGLFKGNQIIATVTIEPLNNKNQRSQQVKLRQMVVSPSYQKQGLGHQLIKETEQVLREKSVASISLAARLPAVPFYQSLGYQGQGPVYHHLRIDHQNMMKKLV